MKNKGGKSQRREEKKRENQRRGSQEKEDPGARKGRKVAKHCVSPVICDSRGSRREVSRVAKAAGAKPCGQIRDEQLHAVAARSTCPSQNVQSTPWQPFWKLRCQI